MNPDDFESELTAALWREEPPPDFARGILARVERKRRAQVRPWAKVLPWAIAAGIALGAVVPVALHQRAVEREARAQQAKHELLVALNITQSRLRHTRELLLRHKS